MKRVYAKMQQMWEKTSSMLIQWLSYNICSSSVSALIIVVLYIYGCIHQIREVLPHIMTFSSVLLAVIGIVYSVILSFNGAEFFEDLKTNYSAQIQELYDQIRTAIWSSIFTVGFSLLVLGISLSWKVAKYIVAFWGSYCFFSSIFAVICSFSICMDLVELDLKRKKKK